MRIIRFQHDDHISYGSIEHKNVCVWSKAPWLGGIATNQLIPLAEVKLMAPCEPRKIIATAINYPGATGSTEKMEEPLVFFKPSTSVGIIPKTNPYIPLAFFKFLPLFFFILR